MSDVIRRSSARKLGLVTCLGLGSIAVAAASLSFASLRSLAMLAGTPEYLAWLYPITLDATMMVATRMWVGVDVPDRARRFARLLALATIAASVAGNAGQHALSGGGAWWPVVVGAVPAAVLAAVAHLVALARLADTSLAPTTPAAPLATVTIQPAAPVDQPPPTTTDPEPVVVEGDHQPPATNQPADQPDDLVERARELVAAGAGRTKLMRELGVSDHRARQLKRQADAERRPALHAVGGGSR